MKYAIATDCGRERENNEDLAHAEAELGLFIIADGMGGHHGGEVASRVAVETLVGFLKGNGPTRDLEAEATLLCEATMAANRAVMHQAEERDLSGMGTTLTALTIRGRTASVAHVGDTRAYFLKEEKLAPLTRDQNVASMLVEQGLIEPAEANDHPERHMLTQAIGTQAAIEPDVIQLRIPKDARILMSTDGLHDVVPEAEICEIASRPDLEEAAHGLTARANDHGGPDNVTVILIDP